MEPVQVEYARVETHAFVDLAGRHHPSVALSEQHRTLEVGPVAGEHLVKDQTQVVPMFHLRIGGLVERQDTSAFDKLLNSINVRPFSMKMYGASHFS